MARSDTWNRYSPSAGGGRTRTRTIVGLLQYEGSCCKLPALGKTGKTAATWQPSALNELIPQLKLPHRRRQPWQRGALPNPDLNPENTLFRVVRFGPASFYNSMLDTILHPAPIPDLLQQRNLNALVNHLYKKSSFPRAPFKSGVFAAFWPSCLDLDDTGATCNLCRYDTLESRQGSSVSER